MPAVGVEAAVVTEQMIEEEEKLKQQAEIEAQRKMPWNPMKMPSVFPHHPPQPTVRFCV